MSEPYARVADIRLVLKEATAVPEAVFANLLAAVHAFITEDLGFEFGGDPVTRWFDPDGLSNEIWLPPPGADEVLSVSTVSEGVVTALVDGTDYEMEPVRGRYVLRLDSTNYGQPMVWTSGRRGVSVTWIPARAPASLAQLEVIETVRLFRGQSGGFSDAIGVEGANTIVFKKAFSSITLQHLDTLKRRYWNRMMGL